MNILALGASGILALTGCSDAAYAESVMQVYMSPTGSDMNDGLTIDTPVLTFTRVQDVLEENNPDTDVEVRIKQGVYVDGQTSWTFFVAGHTISFMPVDYEYGMTATEFAGRPIFRSDGTPGWWVYAQLPSGHPGGVTGLRFYYLQVELYQAGGLLIHGRYKTEDGLLVPATLGANGNTVYGMYFRKLGSKYSASIGYGYAGLDLINSSDNLVRANHFLNLENNPPYGSYIHGVYLAHGSSRNQVINNRFLSVSADAVRIRNGSSDNEITGNSFEKVGNQAYVIDWFCDGTCVSGGSVQECGGYDNQIHDNNLISSYTGSTVPVYLLVPPGMTYHGPCTGAIGDRLTAWNNT